MAKSTIYSFRDSRGALWVACSECNRGGNGKASDKCSTGWNCKRGGKLGCFCGTLIDGIEVKEAK